MKCPRCGAEIPEGHLLCDICGEEIQIVPDFEPEVENSITETLSEVAEVLSDSGVSGSEEEEKDGYEKQKNMFVLSLGCIFVLVLIVITTYFSIVAYHKSVSYQIKTASDSIDEGDYETALVSLQAALDGGGDYESIMLQMADCYQSLQDENSYVSCLLELIKYEQATEETLSQAYTRIIVFYEEKEEYEQINALLQNCEISSIREKYTQYMANMPEFNYLEGSYNEVIPLKIFSNTNGHIYYTVNGGNPTKYSEEYISPIFLETGDYEIRAVFINEYGITSPYARVTYHVDVSIPFAPEIDAYSGDFYTPQLIHAEAEEGCQIYYTTDGTEPTSQSTLYNGFLPMPLGDSSFKFVAIDENGVSSEVTVRNYHLELITDYTKDDAMAVLKNYLIASGKTIDFSGTISLIDLRKQVYNFACCVNIVDEGDFYIFSEYIENLDGSREKTGNYYAVGVYNMPLYGTQFNASTGTFALSTELLMAGNNLMEENNLATGNN